jgi:hypothetical protein
MAGGLLARARELVALRRTLADLQPIEQVMPSARQYEFLTRGAGPSLWLAWLMTWELDKVDRRRIAQLLDRVQREGRSGGRLH